MTAGMARPAPDAAAPAASAAVPALEVSGLSHAFGPRLALCDVALRVMPGDFTVLLGPNGAGKSTLFALVTRLFDARDGDIRIFGQELAARPEFALARLGVVFQQPTLDADISVRQNLYYAAALHGMPRAVARRRAAQELQRIGMADRAGDRVRDLSGGQRRRVEIARALLPAPSLLLLDEPTVGLDAASRSFLLDHVHRLCREEGLAVLWATHLIDEVAEDARVVVLHAGKLRATGTVPEILEAAGGAPSVREAFARLTGERRGEGASA
ncbi:MAG TPA: ATP-binding cassette domain-containing protein [Crenalkalicoccus sp.]|jgi:ABC-2 type transport system ATP-binding protein|nr:ATP-binding cassette domain-containing protein [Crenalkalicoccus sp.]